MHPSFLPGLVLINRFITSNPGRAKYWSSLLVKTPSMRRPVIVKNGFSFSPNLLVERTASAAILLSALFGSDASLGASWASSFQPALPPVYRPCFDLSDQSGPGVIRSHRDSAVPLSNRDLIYITFPTVALFFFSGRPPFSLALRARRQPESVSHPAGDRPSHPIC